MPRATRRAARRRQIGTRKGTRRLGCYKQAVFRLAWFRDKGDIRRLGAGFGLPQSTHGPVSIGAIIACSEAIPLARSASQM